MITINNNHYGGFLTSGAGSNRDKRACKARTNTLTEMSISQQQCISGNLTAVKQQTGR